MTEEYTDGFEHGLQKAVDHWKKLKEEIYEIKSYYGLYGNGVIHIIDAIDKHLKEVTQ